MPKSAEQCELIRDKMRKRILECSLKYFARNGYSGTKISSLAKFIGIGQGTFYSYFASKEDMFKEILNIAVNTNRKDLLELKNAPISAAQKIMILSKNMIEAVKSDSQIIYMFALNVQVAGEGSFDNSFTKDYEEFPNQVLAQIIADGQKEKTLVCGDPYELADFYWSVVHAAAIRKVFKNKHAAFKADYLSRLLIKDEVFKKEKKDDR